MKICTHCKVEKGSDEFYKNSGTRDRLGSWCRGCTIQEATKFGSKNPERVKEIHRGSQKRWRLRNPEKVKAQGIRRSKRPRYKLRTSLSGRVWAALKGIAKSAHTSELLGCPVVWLEVHLESLFKPGMTWKNYGPVWHVDHIKPCASFDLTKSEHQRWCFHWTNLQPLFAADNIRKGAKYAPEGK